MPTSKHRRKGRVRPRGKPPRMPPVPMLPEEEAGAPPNADELLDWHSHIRREFDPRQSSLPL
jgi:hypothetical protein